MSGEPFVTASLAKEVTLALGWRPTPGSKELRFGRLELKKTLANELLAAASGWLAELQEKRAIEFEYDVALAEDEYLSASIGDLQELAARQLGGDGEEGGADTDVDAKTSEAELQAVVEGAFASQDWLDADSLRRNFLFYTVVVRTTTRDSIAFIKQTGPQRLAKAGGWLTAFDGTLDTFDKPILVVEPDVDLILIGDKLAILRPLAFERLCSDLQLSDALVPTHADTVSKAVPLAAGALDAIIASCRQRKRNGALLRQLSSLTPMQWSKRTIDSIKEVLERHQLDESEFITSDDKILAHEGNVKALLEVLTSRYYTSDFDDEERAADRSRLRR